MTSPKLTLIALACASTFVLARPARAGTPATLARTAKLEIIDDAGRGSAKTTRVTLTLARGRTSRVDVDDGQTRYHLSINSQPAGADAAIVALELQQSTRARGKARTTTKVSLSARVALARRVEAGRVGRPGGGQLRLALTLE